MGGHAFDPEGLSTPRMPPEIYHQVSERILSILRQHFRHANSPIEAPAKVDHGDIDILVTGPVDPKALRNPEYLADLLGAKRWKRVAGSDTINLAVPWPTSTEPQPVSASLKRPPSSSGPIDSEDKSDSTTGLTVRSKAASTAPDKYIQIDLSILPNHTTLSWLLFLHSYGDLWSVLGSVLRRFGLTCTPSGFHLHIPEIEGQNKSLSRVKITDQPGLVLRYLGLEEERYWRGFESWDEMLGYVCGSRFVDLGRRKRKEEHERREREEMEANEEAEAEALTDNGDATVDRDVPASEATSREAMLPTAANHASAELQNGNASNGTATSPALPATNMPTDKDSFKTLENGGPPLKSNDRARASKRPLFAYFLTTYIDAHSTLDTPPGSAAKLTKQDVVNDAKEFFSEEFAERYEKARRKGMEVIGVQGLWSNVRNMIKEEGGEGDELGYGMKGVKGCICGVEFAFLDSVTCPSYWKESVVDGVAYEGLSAARESFRDMRYDEVLEWAKVNWRKVGERQKRIDIEISGKKMAAKIEMERIKVMGNERRGSPWND